MRRIICAACLAIAAAIPLAAAAEEAFTVRTVDVFAGPSSEYPPITQLPPSYRVDIFGCLADWSWCDVGFAGDRGWIYAGDLVVPYQGSRVAVVQYGPRIHIHIVSFSLIPYWEAHYRTRSFYRDRTVWAERVQIQANHGGRPPSGASTVTRAAPQNPPSTRSAQERREATTQADRHARTEKARPAETARAPAEERRATEERRANVAQTPRPEAQPQRERKGEHEAQSSHAAPSAPAERHAQTEQQAQPEQRSQPEQKAQPERHAQ